VIDCCHGLAQPFGGAEHGAARAGIAGDLFVAGLHRSTGEVAQCGDVTAAAEWYLGRADAVRRLAAQVLLDHTVLKRMKADYHEPSTSVGGSKAEQAVGLRKSRVKAVEFTIDTDPERKKDLGGGVDLGSAPCAPHNLLYGFG